MHMAKDDAPGVPDHVPRGQFPQSSATLAPIATKNFPVGQSVQLGLVPYFPLGHGSTHVQASATRVGFMNLAHSLQDVCPAVL